jgi:ubiquinone/menaquinone biosynthesis C-methylase UbiE
MGYNPIAEELKWWDRGNGETESSRRSFAHSVTRSRLYDTLLMLGCKKSSAILDVGCGSGGDAVHIRKISGNITGVDISEIAIKKFRAKGFKGILADVRNLPFRDNSFDYVICSGILHHLVGQGDLRVYLREFARVARDGGYVVALEPNVFNLSGLMMNIFNTLKPGITGLVPHERALSPLRLVKIFRETGLKQVEYVAASYVWNRFPVCFSRFISEHEMAMRLKRPFNLFGWFEIIYGRKGKPEAGVEVGQARLAKQHCD